MQGSITQATVQLIDLVDQHNGSRGCISGCDAWCSGSRTAIASPAPLLLPSDRKNKWITGSSKGFHLSIFLLSCLHFSSFLSCSRALTLGCVLLSLARTLRLAFVRNCALSFAFRFVFWACLCLSPCLSSSVELPCLSPGLPQGVSRFFDLPVWEFLRLSFGPLFRA